MNLLPTITAIEAYYQAQGGYPASLKELKNEISTIKYPGAHKKILYFTHEKGYTLGCYGVNGFQEHRYDSIKKCG